MISLSIGEQPLKKTTLRLLTLAVLLLAAACGEVVTPEPTVGPEDVIPQSTPRAGTGTPPPPQTMTAPPLPPADTATPTATPAPITHVVQQGDTLYSIAFDYGVDPEALQAVNNIENPQLLQLGQELIIPSEEETTEGGAAGNLLPTATPLPLGVRGVAFYETPVGSLWCMGEVVNTTDAALTNAQVRVTLLDEAGAPVAEADAFAAADLIPAGTRSPFGILFTTPPQSWANSQVTVVRGEVAGELAAAYVPMEVTAFEGQPADNQFRVTGSVQNTSAGQTAGSAFVIVTTYDAEGQVTGFRQQKVPLEAPLPPGNGVPFDLLMTVHESPPADLNVVALGRTPTS
jgi:LysM repeat protein